MKDLSSRQHDVLTFIEDYIEENSTAPALREIAEHFSFSDKAAWDVIEALIKKEMLEKSEGHRSIRLRKDDRERRETKRIELYHYPFTAERLAEKADDYIFFEKSKVADSDYFAISVYSYSMKNAGILPGDIAILSKDISSIKDDDIVLAAPSESESYEMELRRLRKTPYFKELWPENDSMGIIKASEFSFYGKLCYVVRSYK